jgi:hypothetical protein
MCGATGAPTTDPCFPQFDDIVAARCDLTRHTLRGTAMRRSERPFIAAGQESVKAPFGHAAMSELSLLSGVNRTSRLRPLTSEFDPTQTSSRSALMSAARGNADSLSSAGAILSVTPKQLWPVEVHEPKC